MHHGGAEAMISEEPDERMVHVRICGGAGRATAGSTRMYVGSCKTGAGANENGLVRAGKRARR